MPLDNQGFRYEAVTLPEAAGGEAHQPEVAELSRLGTKPVGEKCELGNVKLQTTRSSMLKAGSSVENWSRWQLTSQPPAASHMHHSDIWQRPVGSCKSGNIYFWFSVFFFSAAYSSLTRMIIPTEVRFNHTYQD